jgi:hypothetical protein
MNARIVDLLGSLNTFFNETYINIRFLGLLTHEIIVRTTKEGSKYI